MKNSEKTDKIGLIYALSAFVLWGFLVVFFKQFEGVNPYEIVAHRILWSVIVLFILLAWLGRLKSVRANLLNFRVSFWLFVSGFALALSWCIFVYAVDNDLVLEASLGNFISPIFSILIGYFILKEQLSFGAKISFFIVMIAIGIQVVAVGTLPILAISLAAIVSVYALIRKKVKIGALEGLFIENLLISPIGIAYIFYLISVGDNHFNLDKNGMLLILCGPVTIVPLLFFTAATKLISLSTIGYTQYINPSISMLLAIFVYNESIATYKLVSFCLIWLALFVVSAYGIYTYKKDHR
ncbi:EamA family transporter RarD [Campylobacter sp. faydin G-140]|uniref:EamA family transporter RarD n=1 Tax=Campylobacter anatolicus TaxID=2829105 RepID=UPI001B97FE21|nr:EamA family transporter RarD [Campylobacter anatolicus]